MKCHVQSILSVVWKKHSILKPHLCSSISTVRLLQGCKGESSSENKKQLGDTVRCSPIPLACNVFHPKEGYDTKLSPIMFCHCILSCKESWGETPQIIANKTKRKAYAVDMRNHGDSNWSDDCTFEANLEDLHCFMDKWGIKETVFIGHSFGAMVGMMMATRHPEKIDSLFISDTLVGPIPEHIVYKTWGFMHSCELAVQMLPPDCDEASTEKMMVDYINDVVASKLKCSPQKCTNLPGFLQETATKPRKVTRTLAGLKKGTNGQYLLKANSRVLKDFVQSEKFSSYLHRNPFDKPATFICASDSYLDVCNDEAVKKYFPAAELITIQGTSHFLHVERPDEFADIVIKRLHPRLSGI